MKYNQSHGHSTGGKVSGTYATWCGMKARCTNPNCKEYRWYGARGITFCERWHKFENFLEDMGDKPAGLTLERNDPNLDYSKDNCRWATRKEQANNTRRNVWISFKGERHTVSQWAQLTGIPAKRIRNRHNAGWNAQDMFSKQVFINAIHGVRIPCVETARELQLAQ